MNNNIISAEAKQQVNIEEITLKGSWIEMHEQLLSMEREATRNLLLSALGLGKLYYDYRQHQLEETGSIISLRDTADYFNVGKDKISNYAKVYVNKDMIIAAYNKDTHTSLKKLLSITNKSKPKLKIEVDHKSHYKLQIEHMEPTQKKLHRNLYGIATESSKRSRDRDISLIDAMKQEAIHTCELPDTDTIIMNRLRVSKKVQKLYTDKGSDVLSMELDDAKDLFTHKDYTTKTIKEVLGKIDTRGMSQEGKGMVNDIQHMLLAKLSLDKVCDLEYQMEQYYIDNPKQVIKDIEYIQQEDAPSKETEEGIRYSKMRDKYYAIIASQKDRY